jgi:3',5'-cyclic AMP phosphodiesterase CpdA
VHRIFHISDVHFGPPHLPRLAAAALEEVERGRPDLVVISGDLTQRAKPLQFQQARQFVDRLPVSSLVVPGNHDVPLYRFWERIFSPFGAYRSHFSDDLEPIFESEGLLVIGINTAFNWTLKDGRVTDRRLQEVADRLRRAPQGVFRVVVAHHHLIPTPSFGSQRVAFNARRAIDLLSSLGADLILSGHQHESYIGNSEDFYPRGREPMVIVHAGTTTSSRGRGKEKEKNTCNWILVTDRWLQVSNHRWEPELSRFAEHSRHFYPRRGRSPYTLEGLAL